MKNATTRRNSDVNTAQPNKIARVAICIPCLGDWKAEFGLCMSELVQSFERPFPTGWAGITNRTFAESSSNLTFSRTKLVEKAINEFQATHVLFLDSDMSFPPYTLHALLSHDVPFVACNYAKKEFPVECTASMGMDDDLNHDRNIPENENALVSVDAIGFGVTLINTDVFFSVPRPWFQFTEEVVNGRHHYPGEDYSFCQKVREAGISIYVDTVLSKEIGHVGSFTYRLGMTAPGDAVTTP